MTLQSVYGASGGEPGQRCRREPAACPRHRRGVRPRGGRAPRPEPLAPGSKAGRRDSRLLNFGAHAVRPAAWRCPCGSCDSQDRPHAGGLQHRPRPARPRARPFRPAGCLRVQPSGEPPCPLPAPIPSPSSSARKSFKEATKSRRPRSCVFVELVVNIQPEFD